ncbi:MAG: 2-C-methyl-D-erythritol 4-phosphate cytidylyltransferase [Firmicutes bacterium]|nr:2-C-methyl-D-erythritol 4-phosphate cytidylyltransferase [Bacillota bacterium]
MGALRVGAVIAAAGFSRRMRGWGNKQLLPLGDRSVLAHTLQAFEDTPEIREIVIVVRGADKESYEEALSGPRSFSKASVLVEGGPRRQDSVRKGLEALSTSCEVVLVHDGARPLVTPELISRVAAAAAEWGAAVPALEVADTVKRVDEGRRITATVPREGLWLVQTPQGFRRGVLEEAFRAAAEQGLEVTDEAGLVEASGGQVRVIEGLADNFKITTPGDLAAAEGILAKRRAGGGSERPRAEHLGTGRQRTGCLGMRMRTGFGYDVHRLVPGCPLILGGETIPFPLGLEGHSDADVLIHAVMDALLGAAALGDIGLHFPDSDARWKDARSLDLLAGVAALVAGAGYEVANVDGVVVAQQPRLAPYRDRMAANIGRALGIPAGDVGVKATTTEGLGFTGAGEGIAAYAVCLLEGKPGI